MATTYGDDLQAVTEAFESATKVYREIHDEGTRTAGVERDAALRMLEARYDAGAITANEWARQERAVRRVFAARCAALYAQYENAIQDGRATLVAGIQQAQGAARARGEHYVWDAIAPRR